eukprot:s232_g29.t1
MEAPPELKAMMGMSQNQVCLLKGNAYGRVDAPLLFYREFRKRLEDVGFSAHPLDSCLFLLRNAQDPQKLDGILGTHVDDGIGGGNENFEKALEKLQKTLPFGTREYGKFKFTGLDIEQLPDGSIKVNQGSYEWSDFLAQRQSEQDAFVEKLLQQVPLFGSSAGIETRNSSELPTISKAFLSPARMSHLSASTPDMTVVPSSRQALPNPTFRSEKMLMSDADLAAEAECRMKQFVEEEDSITVSRKTSVRRSRNHSSISEDDDKLHSVREFAERTSALENLVSTMRSNKRLHHWFNRLPCGKRFLRYFVNSLDYLNS